MIGIWFSSSVFLTDLVVEMAWIVVDSWIGPSVWLVPGFHTSCLADCLEGGTSTAYSV